jgi:hypothetical protein
MKPYQKLSLTLLLAAPLAGVAQDQFLTDPSKLHSDPRFSGDQIFFVENVRTRLADYDSVMVDEPVIFIAPGSPYTGFKGSDMAALSDLLRRSFIEGLTSEPVSFGSFKSAEQPGAGTLFVRLALKDVYIRKNKRGLLAYTPVGAVAKGVKDAASDAIDKTTLVEMTVEAELQDSKSGDVLFAIVMNRGQREDKASWTKEDAADWEATGAIAGLLGRRLACRLDNARLPEARHRDCIQAIPIQL